VLVDAAALLDQRLPRLRAEGPVHNWQRATDLTTSGLLAKGRFGKQDFVYVAADDVYLCPSGEQLTYHYTNEEDGKRKLWPASILNLRVFTQSGPNSDIRQRSLALSWLIRTRYISGLG
jgi:hypothetical protein